MKPLEKIDEEVRAKVIEAVPDIVELKFGCRLKSSNSIATIYHIYADESVDAFIIIDDGLVKFTIEKVKSEQIFGRPITLADVLIAMELLLPDGSWIIANQYLCFHDAYTDEELLIWNLTKSYEEQEETVKRFIHSVICIK